MPFTPPELRPSAKAATPARALASAAVLVVCAALAGCADQTPQATASQPATHIPPQDFAPGTVVEGPPPANEAQLTNDPSAPANTPLCGTAAREANQIAAANYPEPGRSGNACVLSACYDAQTATYIGADGNRHICR
ncbi:hypothetical protein [Ameyamaea chiangmaiensis]|uniref:hypothetical protein n=1 Tax=Ameyamaea chiangmaiensis TaxID=442969 RepID=UPI0035714226